MHTGSMPGGRLTAQDRTSVAEGLAAGLPLAEIARRLGRPTSTISREVMRNGGGARYRAEVAHRDTRLRARSRTPGRRNTPATPADPYGRDDAAIRAFQQRFAAHLVDIGLQPMAARVLACLYTSDAGRRGVAELVGLLRVSPASVSTAVAYLHGLGLITRERAPGSRREQYVVRDDFWTSAWVESARRNAASAEIAQLGVGIFGAGTPAGARLSSMARFFARLSAEMAGGPSLAALDDGVTLLSALLHAGSPRAEAELAATLGWDVERVATAARCALEHPRLGGPVVLVRGADGRLTAGVDPDRLDAVQRAALERGGSATAARPPCRRDPA